MMVMEGVSIVKKCFRVSYTDDVITPLPFSPCESLTMPIIWNFSWRKNSLDANVVFLVYMSEIVCSYSDSYEELFR